MNTSIHRLIVGSLLLAAFALSSCQSDSTSTADRFSVSSPDARIQVETWLSETGRPAYRVQFADQALIDTSFLGFEFRGAAPLREGFRILTSESRTIDETWPMPWGEYSEVRNHANELRLSLADSLDRRMDLVFRVFDDGLGFRYEFPEQEGMDSVFITAELTEFALTSDPTCWWIPGDWDIYEHIYNETAFSAIDALSKRDHPNLAQTYIPENAVNTPITMKTTDGVYLSIHEAALYDYAGMTLRVNKEDQRFESALVAWADGDLVKQAAPFQSPWRTIQIADRAGDLIESTLILNLNEPNKLENTDWIKPMKYAGIWWEMHLGASTWELASGRHGATTENAKRYIDFCATNDIEGLLIEGWNTGWERWIGFEDREGVFDFVTPYEDYDIEEVVRYGKEKGVDIIMHHETSAAPRTYEQQLDTAFALMQRLGMHAVKTGYVGPIIPKGERHHGQWMVRHYQKVVERAADYQVAIDAHEPIKATGIRRTWPNFMTREGLRGQEFNAWSNEGGNPVDHLPTVAFTRMLAGPIDYTPGVFNLTMTPYRPDNRVKHTLAHELALYIVIYSPLQMVSDLPQHLEGQPGMQFVRDVAVDWSDTKVLNGEPSDFVTIARKERDGARWFLGSITNEEARTLNVALDFLDEGVTYELTRYEDGPGADWETNPGALTIETEQVTASDELTLDLVPGGGAAMLFVPVDSE